MGAETLSDRAIIGMFYLAFEEARQSTWIPSIAARIDSDQEGETLPFLSSSPVMREWIGGRLSKGFDTKTIRTENIHWEATIEFLTRELRRDKTGQIRARIAELGRRAVTHPQKLISERILAGESSLCYDGQYFFDTDHAEGSSGAQSNSITIDISATDVPLAQQGTTTRPSAWSFAYAIRDALSHLMTIKDDQGELFHPAFQRGDGQPMAFTVMAPSSLFYTQNDLACREFAWGAPNPLALLPNVKLELVFNPRLTWTDKFAIFRTDSDVKPFVLQVETEIALKAKAEGSEFEFDTEMVQYGVDAWHNVNYGYWQHAVLAQLV